MLEAAQQPLAQGMIVPGTVVAIDGIPSPPASPPNSDDGSVLDYTFCSDGVPGCFCAQTISDDDDCDSGKSEYKSVETTPYNQRAHPVPWRDLWSPPNSPERCSEREICSQLTSELQELDAWYGFVDAQAQNCFRGRLIRVRQLLVELKSRDVQQWTEWKVMIVTHHACWKEIVADALPAGYVYVESEDSEEGLYE